MLFSLPQLGCARRAQPTSKNKKKTRTAVNHLCIEE